MFKVLLISLSCLLTGSAYGQKAEWRPKVWIYTLIHYSSNYYGREVKEVIATPRIKFSDGTVQAEDPLALVKQNGHFFNKTILVTAASFYDDVSTYPTEVYISYLITLMDGTSVEAGDYKVPTVEMISIYRMNAEDQAKVKKAAEVRFDSIMDHTYTHIPFYITEDTKPYF